MAKKIGKFEELADDLLYNKLDRGNQILKETLKSNVTQKYFPEYREFPVEYIKDILGATLWKKQREVAKKLVEKRKVLVRSSHLVGKSFLCAALSLWAYDTHDPLSGIVTAPTAALVKEVVFSEMRVLSRPHHEFRGTSAPLLQREDEPDHVIRGLTTNDPTSMQGRHRANNFLLIDEAVGVSAEIWEPMNSLFAGNAYWLAVYNPTDSSSFVHTLESSGDWELITISALEHPNIVYALTHPGDKRVIIPGSITLDILRPMIRQWSKEINPKDKKSTDIMILDEEWNEVWYRPGPICEARLLGRWPSQSFNSVWSDTLVDQICSLNIAPDYENDEIEIGVDVARFGSDNTAIVARCGPIVIMAEEYNGLSITEVANIVMVKARELSDLANVSERDITIKIDSNGLGGGVVDILYDFNYRVIDVDVNKKSYDPDKYDKIRSQLWFNLVELAEQKKVSLYHLDTQIKHKIRGELLGPQYEITAGGQMTIESKERTKKRTKRPSPNLGDATNLAFFEDAPESITVTRVAKRR